MQQVSGIFMIKKIVIVLIFSIIMQASAMEIQSTIDEKICYLFRLPLDVQNLIAYFCDYETEEELIARPEKTDDGYALCKKYNLCDKYDVEKFDFISFCFDESKVALYQCDNEGLWKLTLIDRKEDKILYSAFPGNAYDKMAISPLGTVIALGRPVDCYNTEEDHFLCIKNIVVKKEREIKIDGCFDIHSIAFNKQGTDIIVHHSSRYTPKRTFSIFPSNNEVKKINTLLEIKDFNQKSPFQQYLIERRICKSIEASK
jgi:hypothetical protein